MLSGRVTAPSPALTWAVKLKAPTVVGIPEITPELAVRVRPSGRSPAAIDQV